MTQYESAAREIEDWLSDASRKIMRELFGNNKDKAAEIGLRDVIEEIVDARTEQLRGLLEAVLLFHSVGPWDEDKSGRWKLITGNDEATTRALCDTIRASMK
jgi:hypothetical protein